MRLDRATEEEVDLREIKHLNLFHFKGQRRYRVTTLFDLRGREERWDKNGPRSM